MDDASVRLSAIDDVSAPVSKAIDSLQQYQAALDSLASLEGRAVGGASAAASGINNVAAASEHSVGSHRAAHAALNLVSGGLVQLAGGTAAAEGGVRVLDAVMFQMAVTGGTVSLGFVALIAAAAAVGYAFKSSAEEAKKEQEAMDKLTESTVKYVSQLNTLDRVQKSVAGVGAGQLSTRLIELKTQIGDLTAKMKENAAASQSGTGASFLGSLKNAYTGGSTGKALAGEEGNQSQIKMAGQLRALVEEQKKVQHEYDVMTGKAAAFKSVLQDQGDPLKTYSAAMERSATDIADVGRALGDTSATMGQVAAMADNMGVDYVRAAGIMAQQTQLLKAGVGSLASTFGETLGKAISGGKDAWREGLKAMISAVFDAATGVVMAAAIMNQAISAALIPGTFAGILGMVIVLQALKQVAIAAIDSATSQAASQAQSASGISNASLAAGTSPSSVGGASAPAGAGGAAISSSQSQVTNNVVVNLPIQALDLSAISDIQLKSLANRVGRVLADAAGTGQFSLAGA